MPTDPQEGIDDWFVPADPSQWQSRGLPQIIVRPKPPLTGPSDDSAGADGSTTGFVPGQSPSGAVGRTIAVRTCSACDPHPLPPRRTAPPILASATRPRRGQIRLRPIGRSSRRAASAPWPGTRRSFPILLGSSHSPRPRRSASQGSRSRACLALWRDLPATNGADSYGTAGRPGESASNGRHPSYGLLGAMANLSHRRT